MQHSATMQIYSNVKRLCSSLQDMVTFRRRKDAKRQFQISEPFNFKKEPTTLPGLNEDEISVLREKAAASRLGIADPISLNPPNYARSRSASPAYYSHPRPPPPIPIRTTSRRATGPHVSRSRSLRASSAAAAARSSSSSVAAVPLSATMPTVLDLDMDFAMEVAHDATGLGIWMGPGVGVGEISPVSTASSGFSRDFRLGTPVSPLSPKSGGRAEFRSRG
ncbi:hypothetical protein B0T25DRAFT_206384 [Lasiosphaeria hispida]|uniref:Uncharacterized protein n=1 Tax=Lasiosphaeria hispida TaxID=260671 RepID=A0AAJ0HIC8_9PEZI|nr:hypothetical protein B0T25DRAFT_206384 [Lasiosphaeria hispida]